MSNTPVLCSWLFFDVSKLNKGIATVNDVPRCANIGSFRGMIVLSPEQTKLMNLPFAASIELFLCDSCAERLSLLSKIGVN